MQFRTEHFYVDQMNKQETCQSIKLRELSACGRFVSHTKATEHKFRMTAHGPSSTSQLRRPRMLRCHCLPPRSLHVLGAFGSLSKSHISFKVTLNCLYEIFSLCIYSDEIHWHVFHVFAIWSPQTFHMVIYCGLNIKLHCFHVLYVNVDHKL